MSLRLDWCSYEAARYAVEHWHYSRSLPMGKAVHIGVWEDSRFIGALQFRNGANNNMSKPYGLTQWECIELSRVALTTHKAQVSRILSIAVRLLRKQSPGLRLLVSYADPMQEHHGGIYQGAGWIYTGGTGGDTEYFIDGRWRKARNFRSSDFSKYNGMDYRRLPTRKTPGKHRYLYPLDAAMREQIKPLAKPYPKRATSIDSDAPGVQSGDGDASSTVALQTEP